MYNTQHVDDLQISHQDANIVTFVIIALKKNIELLRLYP